MRHPSLCTRSGGFTLVELLVVISIIALLIGILLPALGSARAMARGIRCLSNQHQLSVLLAVYATDNPDRWPVVNLPKNSPQWAGTTWAGRQWRWHADFLYPLTPAGDPSQFDDEAFGSMFTCPSVDDGNVDTNLSATQQKQASARGYGMNNRLNIAGIGTLRFPGNNKPYSQAAKEFFKRPLLIKSPSSTMLTADWTWFADLAPSPSLVPAPTDAFVRRLELSADRHADGISTGFADGHGGVVAREDVPPSSHPAHPQRRAYLAFWDGSGI